MTTTSVQWLSSAAAGLAELVLPGACAGCGESQVSSAASGRSGAEPAVKRPESKGTLRYGVCEVCVASVAALRPYPTAPDPVPAGLPPCAALGAYQGVLRELVLAYKDRGRHRLARPLGRLLADVVVTLAGGSLLLVPVPDTSAAARARHGDHLWRLARPAAARLRAAGIPVAVARSLRARPRPDSAGLSTADRAAVAGSALQPRRAGVAAAHRLLARTGASVVLLDDVVTTGATLAAATARLRAAGIPVAGAAVLAATQRHR